jgi:methylglutaconyl-CoA hydratase
VSTELICELDRQGVLHLSLNRTEKSNALNSVLLSALNEAVLGAGADSQVRLLVFTGLGKHFCSGADTDAPISEVKSRPVRLHQLCHTLYLCPKPMLAQVQGACLGAGVALIAGCDWVLADPTAFFSLPEVRLGFAPGPLLPYLTRAMPARLLKPYVLSGARFQAEQALSMGLVHRLADIEQSPKIMAQTIDDLLLAAPQAQTSVKGLFRQIDAQVPTLELADDLQAQVDPQRISAEADEARAAAKEKRRPNWMLRP